MSYSATNRNFVFPAFLYALGTGKVDGDYKNSISAVLTNSTFYDDIFKKKNIITLKYNDILNYTNNNLIPTNLVLEKPVIDSYNKDTLLKSENTYEEILNTPASGYIFSKDKNNNSWVMNDFEYPENNELPDDSDISNYFKTQYNFNENYMKEEYRQYALKEDNLIENVICISADDLNLTETNGNTSALKYGANGVLLLYTDHNRLGNNSIPMSYYEFPKVFYSTNNILNVYWHTDGIIKVE